MLLTKPPRYFVLRSSAAASISAAASSSANTRATNTSTIKTYLLRTTIYVSSYCYIFVLILLY